MSWENQVIVHNLGNLRSCKNHLCFLTLTGLTRLHVICQNGLPADVAADDHVATEDGAGAHFLVDRMRNDTGSHRELDGARVDDADHVTGSGGLENAEERPVAAVLGVKLDDLPFV